MFRYCTKCDVGMDEPMPHEDMLDGQMCPACGEHQPKA